MKNLNRPCIVWGATGQAEVVFDILQHEGSPLIHLFDNDVDIVSPISGVPISYGEFGLISFLNELSAKGVRPSEIDCVAAIGGSNGEARQSITGLMETHGFKSRNIIHKNSIVSPLAKIGKGVQLLAGSIIGPFASIGDFTIINSGANVDHGCTVGRMCHLAPRATLAGEVKVDDNVFIGANSTVLPWLHIGEGAVVGAGAVVTKDVTSGSVVVGCPARPLLR